MCTVLQGHTLCSSGSLLVRRRLLLAARRGFFSGGVGRVPPFLLFRPGRICIALGLRERSIFLSKAITRVSRCDPAAK